MQISYGFLKSPEALEPNVSVHRVTASATYMRRFGADIVWASTLGWGENIPRGSSELTSNAVLLESNLEMGLNAVFGRAEIVQKNDQELVLPEVDAGRRFWVGDLALGYVRSFGPYAGLVPGVGLRASLDFVEQELAGLYGGRVPVGAMIFVRLRPQEMMRGMMGM
jgi:hypothetical protein